MNQLGYGEFSAGLRRTLRPHRIPMNATFELTHRCPLECLHCYNNLPMDDGGAARRELSLEEYRRLLDETAELGCLWVLFTGGEVFARPEFLEIYTHARRRGFLVTIFTNGTLITPRVADHLARWRPFSIEITLYGRSRETYERLTGVPGSHQRCMRGIRLLLERGLPLKLKTVAVTVNKHELDDMRRFAEELGVPFKFDALLNPRIDCSASPLEARLRPEEVVELDLRYGRRAEEWRRLAERARAGPPPPAEGGELYGCGGGVTAFAVDPYGKMSICVLSRREEYDLREGTVREGWEEFIRRVRARKRTRPTRCSSCRIQPLCGMCPATGELENGDPEEPVDHLCRVAHLRAHALGVPVPPHGRCEYCPGGERHEEVRWDLVGEVSRKPHAGGAPALVPLSEVHPLGAGFPEAAGCGEGGCSSCSLAASHGRDGRS